LSTRSTSRILHPLDDEVILRVVKVSDSCGGVETGGNEQWKKFAFNEISEKESKTKLYKVLKKTMLHGKKLQINLSGALISKLRLNEKLPLASFLVFTFNNRGI
jgi:hypothetical protein